MLVGVLTGNCNLNGKLNKISISGSDFDPSCGEEEETSEHYVCCCAAYMGVSEGETGWDLGGAVKVL